MTTEHLFNVNCQGQLREIHSGTSTNTPHSAPNMFIHTIVD